jgi:hypothetical protein
MHRALLTSRSQYFNLAIGGTFDSVAIGPGDVELPDDDTETFKLYVTLLYSGKIPSRGPGEWQKLVRLYLPAEKLQDTQAKNATIDAMHGFIHNLIPPGTPRQYVDESVMGVSSIVELYDGTPPGSPARDLVRDFYADKGPETWFAIEKELLPTEFVYDLVVGLMRERPMFGSFFGRSASFYHDAVAKEDEKKTETDAAKALTAGQ